MSGGFDLADYLPYLLNRAGSRIADAFTQVARDEGLSLAMWRVLAVLHQREPCTVSEIAEWSTIELSTLSRVLTQMEQKRLVRRRRNSRDSRQVIVDRTGGGRGATERLVPVALAYEAAATADFTDQETATLKTLLRRLFANLAELEESRPVDRVG